MCERNQPSPSPSRAVRSFGLTALTRCPVNRPRPAARLNATTCCARVSAYASLGLISSDKSNVSGEFTPLGLTRRMTSICAADSAAARSRDAALHGNPAVFFLETLFDRSARAFSRLAMTKASFWFHAAVK